MVLISDTIVWVSVCSLQLGHGSCGSIFLSQSDVDTGDTEGGESKPVEGSRGMSRYTRGVGFLLTYTSCEESPEEHDTRRRCNSR
jgi:hypothetical protein